MAQPSIIRGDWNFIGTASGNIVPKDASVTPAKYSALPGDQLPVAQQRHQHRALLNQAGTAAAETRWVYRCDAGTGATVTSFSSGLLAACTGDATVTVDLQKNGVSLLTAAIVLTSALAAGDVTSGTLVATPTLVTGDRLTIVATVSAGTGALGSGLLAAARVDESGI